ncbi:carbohydrate kinase, YjeF related protein [Denitrovibrio acetiphilus DSM 12809]|uniref:Bifunctional NAD(P)H-hydrate repair enzyme n=1 Tax=Denitrovibrio acetiphilus (strain DSM 12809 / NBRC 114555 / N2460) TaxID=522772 RepID=D4H0I9_DENA2|nr:bifunctional ADP-dependent NAD(P)H-hydrate dehydratase/NAD(P)H-hydrate epimerase [Denitrovibrio acetiphilus]ADD68502.1 carbohydrate kinase, YjeF related protein [Denitrovibrio acetiphilus DSM 12809]
MEILNSSQMGIADAYAINETGIPSAVLMENAAISVVDEVMAAMPNAVSAAIVTGTGNNGGDGFAVARLLINAGLACDIYLACDETKLKGDALINFNILKNYDAPIFNVEQNDLPSFADYDFVVDALFGTGLARPLEGFYEALVQNINLTANFVVAVDIPSGLSGDTHNVIGECVDADLTVTFARPKLPHVMYPARGFCGDIVVADISIPDFAVDEADCNIFLLDENTLPCTPPREPDSYKGDFGHAVMAGGSEGKSGAVFMASRACARCGAGLTTTAVPEGLIQAAEIVNPEIMSIRLAGDTHFTSAGAEKLSEFMKGKTVLAIGPGIGREEETAEFVKNVVSMTDTPLIIDADGINLIGDMPLDKLSGRCILTPHIGEFARLIGKDKEHIMSERLELAMLFAQQNDIVLVLKSADTIIALPSGEVFVNTTGSPSLSKGGSGDCLTGLIAGFVSQGYDLDESACLGVYTLGRTAEIVSEGVNEKSVLTTDIIENIWKTLNELEENS